MWHYNYEEQISDTVCFKIIDKCQELMFTKKIVTYDMVNYSEFRPRHVYARADVLVSGRV